MSAPLSYKTSMWLDFEIPSQFMHKFFSQSFSIPFKQFRDFATILAIVVLPTPRIPVKRYAFGTLSALIELIIVSDTTF